MAKPQLIAVVPELYPRRSIKGTRIAGCIDSL